MVGVGDAKNLLEVIPNKIKDILGIIVQVNLHKQSGKEYLEIVVDSYPYPISYKGQYHFRSGATKQELKGAAAIAKRWACQLRYLLLKPWTYP